MHSRGGGEAIAHGEVNSPRRKSALETCTSDRTSASRSTADPSAGRNAGASGKRSGVAVMAGTRTIRYYAHLRNTSQEAHMASTAAEMVARARAHIENLDVAQTERELERGALLVDIREQDE